jgi:hypothetical protein
MEVGDRRREEDFPESQEMKQEGFFSTKTRRASGGKPDGGLSHRRAYAPTLAGKTIIARPQAATDII